ncbi:MAG: geranylgeranyl reductase family protein [Chloroflexi bacterium]|nr:geranylgeranyl reductase family protein [Chloroflexota bacterium]
MQRDVIVIGAGPAGSATAFHLAQAGIDTLLVDKADFPRDKTCGDCLSPRAQHFLDKMSLLEGIAAESHQAKRMHFYAPNDVCSSTDIIGTDEMPNRTLVIPRYRFDHLLQEHAIHSGAEFRVAHVKTLLHDGDRVSGIRINSEAIHAKWVVIATGAATGLLDQAGLKPNGSIHTPAARQYFEGITDLQPELELFFNHISLPGYAWLFPTGPDSANVGIWYCGDEQRSSRTLLQHLVEQHPRLKHVLEPAESLGPLKSYPIRSDFLRAPKLSNGVLAVGEAAGLVNPFTGEGIDYALESAHLAAQAIVAAMGQGPLTMGSLQAYPQALNAHFRQLFLMMAFARRYAFNERMFNRIFGRGAAGQQVIDTLIQICFGAANPLIMANPLLLGNLMLARQPEQP